MPKFETLSALRGLTELDIVVPQVQFSPVFKIGGSLAWKRPKHGNINRKFLNKTVIGTVIQNNIVMKTDSKQKKHTSDLLKTSPALLKPGTPDKSSKETVHKQPVDTNKSKRIVISNKSRLNAYMKSKKEKIENQSTG